MKTTFNDAIVFVVGGGNYIEYQNLRDYVKAKNTGNSFEFRYSRTKGIYTEFFPLFSVNMPLGFDNISLKMGEKRQNLFFYWCFVWLELT